MIVQNFKRFFSAFVLNLICLGICTSTLSYSQSCKVSKLSELSAELVPQATGIARSLIDPTVIYHMSDNGSHLFASSISGTDLRKVKIKIPKAKDAQDMAQGRCFKDKNCLIIGDTGNANFDRPQGHLHIVEEQSIEERHPLLKYLGFISFNFPTPIPDLRAFALHPISGSFYFFSMQFKFGQPGIAKVYTLSEAEMERSLKSKTPANLELAGELDLHQVAGFEKIKEGNSISSADISADGKRLALLMHEGAITVEFKDPAKWDLSQGFKGPDVAKVQALNPVNLDQQEAIIFSTDGKSLLYSSSNPAGRNTFPLYQLQCP